MKRISLKNVSFARILGESLLIIFSIMLALLGNEWRTQRKLEKQKEKYMALIVQEIENNLASLDGVYEYHQQKYELITNYLSEDTLRTRYTGRTAASFMFEIFDRGLNPPTLQSTAWEAAQMTNAVSLISDEEVYKLSVLYKLQETGVDSTWKGIVQVLFSLESYDPESTEKILTVIRFAMNELYTQEVYLRGEYEKALEDLKE